MPGFGPIASAPISAIPEPPWYMQLIKMAEKNLADGHVTATVVIGHMACEAITELAIDLAFRTRGIPDLADPVTDLFPGYNMGNERIWKVYVSLTGDVIAGEPWWSDFKKSSEWRNAAVHSGQRIDKAQAAQLLACVTAFVDHMRTNYNFP